MYIFNHPTYFSFFVINKSFFSFKKLIFIYEVVSSFASLWRVAMFCNLLSLSSFAFRRFICNWISLISFLWPNLIFVRIFMAWPFVGTLGMSTLYFSRASICDVVAGLLRNAAFLLSRGKICALFSLVSVSVIHVSAARMALLSVSDSNGKARVFE